MKVTGLFLCLLILQACSAYQARQQEIQFHQEIDLKTQAWTNSLQRLHDMCPRPPATAEEYQRGKSLQATGADPFAGCDLRLHKLTNSAATDDWAWVWLPPYSKIVDVHEQEVRRLVTLKIYEEYVLGIARFLAKKVDAGEIDAGTYRALFNYSWDWMIKKTDEESALLRENTTRAEQLDAKAWDTLAKIGQGLAIGVVAAAVAYASRPPVVVAPYPTYSPPATVRLAPFSCNASRVWNSVYVSCY